MFLMREPEAPRGGFERRFGSTRRLLMPRSPTSSPTSGPTAPTVVVLAGGLGTRMLPRTERVPKYLLPVAGRPFAEWHLELLARAGVVDVVLAVGHLGDAIREALGDGRRFGLSLRYATEPAELRGTAGALVHARAMLPERFVVTYGDSYLPELDLGGLSRALELAPELDGVLAVFDNDDAFDASNCVVEGARVVRYHKRRLGEPRPAELRFIDYGALALARRALDVVPAHVPSGLDALEARLASAGRLGAFVVATRFYEIGSVAGLAALEALLVSSPTPLSQPQPRGPS